MDSNHNCTWNPVTDLLCRKSYRLLDVDQRKVTSHGVNKCDSRATDIYRALIAMQDDYDAIVIVSGLGVWVPKMGIC